MERMFGEFIKNLRMDRKMTLRDVEEKAQISNAYLSQVESGERSVPSMKILAKLAEVYGVPLSVLNNKAEDQLRYDRDKTKTKKGDSKMPAPDTDFICRGYENLSEDNKQALKKFLQHLQNEDKEKK